MSNTDSTDTNVNYYNQKSIMGSCGKADRIGKKERIAINDKKRSFPFNLD